MKYILKYELKSKYFGFKKLYYKEFNDPFDIFNFLVNNDIKGWKIYKEHDIEISDMVLGE